VLERCPHLGTETVNFAKVNAPLEGIFQKETRLLHANQGEGAAGFNLHCDVDIAVRAFVAAGNRAKDGQVTHATAAEFGFLRGKALSYSVKNMRRHKFVPELQVRWGISGSG
jgi:hypothetical protein